MNGLHSSRLCTSITGSHQLIGFSFLVLSSILLLFHFSPHKKKHGLEKKKLLVLFYCHVTNLDQQKWDRTAILCQFGARSVCTGILKYIIIVINYGGGGTPHPQKILNGFCANKELSENEYIHEGYLYYFPCYVLYSASMFSLGQLTIWNLN